MVIGSITTHHQADRHESRYPLLLICGFAEFTYPSVKNMHPQFSHSAWLDTLAVAYQKHLSYRGQQYPLTSPSTPEAQVITRSYRGVKYRAIAGEALPQPGSLTYRGVRSNPVNTVPTPAPTPVPMPVPVPAVPQPTAVPNPIV